MDTQPIDIERNEMLFISLLKNTGREGMDKMLTALKESGFFTAPASSKFHLDCEGGLCEHSLNVYEQAMAILNAQTRLNPGLFKEEDTESLVIASLLHDVCKADIYKPVQKFKKDENGKWQSYQGYELAFGKHPFGHGEKSVIWLLTHGLKLTNEEMLAIRWHMSNWDMSDSRDAHGNFNAALNETPLLPILIAADQLATWITEKEDVNA